MKKFIIITLVAIVAMACNSKAVKEGQTTNNNVQQTMGIGSFELDSLFNVAEKKVDDTIKVIGYVTHTCKHAGKRCFIIGESQSATMRIEAKGDIGGFNRELAGSKLEITGILRERRLTQEYLEQSEKELNEKMTTEDGSAESCTAELNNISKMKEKMKEMGRDYYSIYFVDGINYEVIE